MFLLLTLVLAFSPTLNSRQTEARKFTTPSQAYAFVRQPLDEWEAAVHSGQRPKTQIAPTDEVQRRAKTWCPVFAVEEQSGEELYSLALLCRDALNWQKARTAIEQYLAGGGKSHGPEARLLLAALENSTAERDKSWQTLRAVLEHDPIGSHQSALADAVIDDEAATDESTALQWSKERYSLLVIRAKSPTADAPRISYEYVILAGADLAHRYYLSGRNGDAQKVLAQLNHFAEEHRSDLQEFASESLYWANLEMQPAPPIPLQKVFSRAPVSKLIQRGHVEIISFFSLGCMPCMRELPALNDLQKRYGKNGLLVADITTYKLNSFIDPPAQSKIDAALKETWLKKAPELSIAVTPDETFEKYGVRGLPVAAVIDKSGRVRYAGREIDFGDDEPIVRLLLRLVAEPVPTALNGLVQEARDSN